MAAGAMAAGTAAARATRASTLVALICGTASTLAAAGTTRPTATPVDGPAARAGESIDRAWGHVSASVNELLLLTRIRVALLERLKEDGLRVTIEVHGGNVELSGQVEHSANAQLAERVAASLEGVRAVRSRVSVATDGQIVEPPVAHVLGRVERSFADMLLDARVKAGLLAEVGKAALDIQVDAAGGVVTLTGTVPDAERRNLAVGAVRSISGVREVLDRLAVSQKEAK